MKNEEVIVHEHQKGWVIIGHFVHGQKGNYIPFDDLETAIRVLALCQCNKFVIEFLNGTSLDVDYNTLEVR